MRAYKMPATWHHLRGQHRNAVMMPLTHTAEEVCGGFALRCIRTMVRLAQAWPLHVFRISTGLTENTGGG